MSGDDKDKDEGKTPESPPEAAETKAAIEEAKEPAELPGFTGVKAGMTRIFTQGGDHVSVTVVKLVPNMVTQVKTAEKDGYEAYQIAYGEKRERLVNRPVKGRLKKAGVGKNLTRFREIRVDKADPEYLGREVSLAGFSPDTWVDVRGVSKGKGFQGVIKRYNFSCGPMAHGSKFHRTGGSIGNRATPGKVWKNKKMPGRMGGETVAVQNLRVVKVDGDKGYMLIRGGVPGAPNGFVHVSRAVKKQGAGK